MHLYRCVVRSIVSAGIALGMTSCVYEYDSCGSGLTFNLVNDWGAVSAADPEGMAFMFFSEDGGELWRFDFPGRDGGALRMPQGNYSMLSFNDDTYSVLFRGDSYGTLEAYTVEAAPPLAAVAGWWRMVECPDMMWGCAYHTVSLLDEGVEYIPEGMPDGKAERVATSLPVLTAFQRQLTARYSFRIEDVDNLGGVRAMSAAMSGLAGSLMLASGNKGCYPVSLPAPARCSGTTTVEGAFVTFGIPSSPTVKNVLALFVLLKDGRKFCYEFDVTEQIRCAPDPLDVLVVLRGLRLEESGPETSGGGFDVGVDGWLTITVNINS